MNWKRFYSVKPIKILKSSWEFSKDVNLPPTPQWSLEYEQFLEASQIFVAYHSHSLPRPSLWLKHFPRLYNHHERPK